MEKVNTVQRLHNIVNIFFQLRNNVSLKMGTDSVHARITIRFASSGSMKVALSRHEFKSPFTWKEDDPSARITLEDSFGLHAKTRLLGSTFHLVYMQDF